MRYIVKASRRHKYDTMTEPFSNIVYDGDDIGTALEKMKEYADYGGVCMESREE